MVECHVSWVAAPRPAWRVLKAATRTTIVWGVRVAATRPAWRVLKGSVLQSLLSSDLGCSDSTRLEGTESGDHARGGVGSAAVAATRPAWRVLKDAHLTLLCLAQKIHLRDFSCFPPSPYTRS